MSLVPDTSMYTFCADPVGPYFAAERAAAQRPAEPYKPGVPIDGFGWDTVSADPKGHNVFMDNLAAWLVSSAASESPSVPRDPMDSCTAWGPAEEAYWAEHSAATPASAGAPTPAPAAAGDAAALAAARPVVPPTHAPAARVAVTPAKPPSDFMKQAAEVRYAGRWLALDGMWEGWDGKVDP